MKSTLLASLALVTFALPCRAVYAQSCLGLPARGAASYQNTRYSIGTGHGAGISGALGHVALGANANTRTMKNPFVNTTGFDGAARAAVILSFGRVMFCPGVGLGYMKLTHKHDEGFDLSHHQASLRGGASIGLEQHLYKGVSIIPAIGLNYDFTAIKYDVVATAGDNETTGDSLSRAVMDYSIGFRYRFAYVGAHGERFGDSKALRPTKMRLILAFAFGAAQADNAGESR